MSSSGEILIGIDSPATTKTPQSSPTWRIQLAKVGSQKQQKYRKVVALVVDFAGPECMRKFSKVFMAEKWERDSQTESQIEKKRVEMCLVRIHSNMSQCRPRERGRKQAISLRDFS